MGFYAAVFQEIWVAELCVVGFRLLRVCLLPKRPMKSGSLVRVNFSTSAQIAYRANPELRRKLVFSKVSV